MERLAHAKINLRLRVLAQERSGFHQIETLLCRIALADRLAVEPAHQLSLHVEGADTGPAGDNLVLRAARAFYELTGLEPGAAFTLTKRIPAGAGLGGGSSDAAAALHLLNALHGEPLDRNVLLHLGAGLGSDVPFFVSGATFALAWGRGERLLELPPPPERPTLVVMPDRHIQTAAAYAALAEARSLAAQRTEPVALAATDLADWSVLQAAAGNDFEAVADRMVPRIAAVRDELAVASPRIVQLSGSGSAVFAVFEHRTDRDRAAGAIAARFSDVSVIPTYTLSG